MKHIITHNGRTYDLTSLETPFGLLPKRVRKAMKAWPHGLELYNKDWHVLRAKPAPDDERVLCFRGVSFSITGEEFGTCIKRNGEIDWSTWEPEA